MGVETSLGWLRKLDNNWDSYGASKVSSAAIDAAEAFLRRVGWDDEALPYCGPWVHPTGNGGVQVEWEDDDLYMEFEFAPDGSVSGYFNDCHATEARFAEKAASAAGVGE